MQIQSVAQFGVRMMRGMTTFLDPLGRNACDATIANVLWIEWHIDLDRADVEPECK